jgi:hypothetical protein
MVKKQEAEAELQDQEHDQHQPYGFLTHGDMNAKSVLHTGYEALMQFLQFANRRFGNIMRTWFQMDPAGTMKLGKMQFTRGVTDLGFHGNIHAMWKYLQNVQDHGHVTILELDPPSALVLAGFKLLLANNFGRKSTVQAFEFFDDNGSGKCYKEEFLETIQRLNYQGPAEQLFDLLDHRGLGFIVPSHMSFLDAWRPPQYLFCQPDIKGLTAFKEALVYLHDNLLRGWCRVLDSDSNLRITWDEFTAAYMHLPTWSSVPRELKEKMPKTKQELASAWRALDGDCAGWIGLREFDDESYETLRDFKQWAVLAHGGVVKAFHAMDNANGKLTRGEIKRGVRDDDRADFDIDLLVDGLDVHDNHCLGENDVKFLDSWDLEWEDWEILSKHRLDMKVGLNSQARASMIATMR